MNQRTRLGAVILGAALFAVSLRVLPTIAQDTAKPVAENVLWRPTGAPDRIILTYAGDPATSIGVTWRTDTSVAPGRAIAQVVPATAYPKFAEKAVNFPAKSTPLTTGLGDAHYHSAVFTGLKPSTQYAYRVGDGENWSEWIHYTTASDKPEPFSFVYFGDAQNDIKSLWSRAIRSAYSDAPKAKFLIHAGDLINNAGNDAQWGEWYYAAGWVNAMVPSIPTPGNHEYNGMPRGLDAHWRAQFTLPENGAPGVEESCYYVDYQGVRIISLNSNEKQQDQVAWLDSVLAKNPNRWTILTFHHPMYSAAKGRDNKELREMWMPVFDKYGVDLVLQGHDHTYARSRNMRAGVNVRDGESGTVYVVSVSGPKMYNLDRASWMQRAAEDTQLYQIVSIDKDTLKYQARTVTGELYDAFELRKGKNRFNKMVDQLPKTKERLRLNNNVEN